VKAIKSDSDSDSDEQKKSPGFLGKNKGVTFSVADPGVTHPSDATVGAEALFSTPLWRFGDSGVVYRFYDLLRYLLTLA